MTTQRGGRGGKPANPGSNRETRRAAAARARKRASSDTESHQTDFAQWLTDEYTTAGDFTALVVLVGIGETKVTPLRSTYLNVIGDEVTWNDMVAMFAGAGVDWDGASFVPVRGEHGALDNTTARLKLRDLEQRVDDDRLVLNEGNFFDKWGRRMRVDEIVQ